MTGKDGAKKEIEIMDPGNPVFSAQVFAEMLGMANKPEYFQHEPEQEVQTPTTSCVLSKTNPLFVGFCHVYISYVIPIVPLQISARLSPIPLR